MCFYASSIKSEPKVAAKDIEVFKFLHYEEGEFLSPFFATPWAVGEVKQTYLGSPRLVIKYVIVSSGFHSCKTVEETAKFRDKECEWGNIYRFVIPKGAEYYENETQYVSNKIKLASAEHIDEYDCSKSVKHKYYDMAV